MSQKEIAEILKLSRIEKLELVQILWDDISKDIDTLNLTPPQIAELDRRLNRINNGEAKFNLWDDVKKKYQTLQ